MGILYVNVGNKRIGIYDQEELVFYRCVWIYNYQRYYFKVVGELNEDIHEIELVYDEPVATWTS